ncbi:MAG: DUF3090 family protein [Dehalococcoidia bacterium]|nr:DUF3090 family protein [Dehalococcoidia bacterium]
MPTPRREFGSVHAIKAAAVGRPGERRFNVRIDAEGGRVLAWVEKQELLQLAMGLQELLSANGAKPDASVPGPLAERRTVPDVEFQVSRLVLGYDRRGDRFILELSDEESTAEDRVSIRMSGSRTQMTAFMEEALGVCAAGRPLCPLCTAPIGPGKHICPKTNGHIVL